MESPEHLISQNASASVRHLKRRNEEIGNNSSDDDEETRGKVLNEDSADDKEVNRKNESKKESKSGSKKGSNSKKKKSEKETAEDDEQDELERQRLERLLFGSLHNPVKFGNEFGDDTEQAETEIIEDPKIKERKPAWVDDEEAEIAVDISNVRRLRKLRVDEGETLVAGSDYVQRLRNQHSRLNPGTDWADLDSKNKTGYAGYDSDDVEIGARNGYALDEGSEDEGLDDILRSNEDLVVKGNKRLLPGIIEISALTNANTQDPSNAVVQSVSFHRNGQILLSAGLDKKLKFFQIDGKKNHKIQSVFIEDMPVHKAEFLPDGSKVIAAGRRKHFYSFDMVKGRLDRVMCLIGREEKSLEKFTVATDSSMIAFTGNEGYILLVSTKSNMLVGTLKMNGTVRTLAFAEDGKQLLSSGGDGQIYHWDIGTRKCVHVGYDDGCINSTALSVSHDSRLFAAGSDSGIVNIYSRDEYLGGVKKPLKVLKNLVTTVDNLQFNFDSQILAMASRMKKNNLRLVHVPSGTVFANWPSSKTPLHYVHSLDFSPGGGLLAVGNAAGKVLLYKLHHYQNA